jgi:hypothetical protein
MKYAFEMGLADIIYILNFKNIGSDTQTLIRWRIHRHKHRHRHLSFILVLFIVVVIVIIISDRV